MRKMVEVEEDKWKEVMVGPPRCRKGQDWGLVHRVTPPKGSMVPAQAYVQWSDGDCTWERLRDLKPQGG